MELFKESWTNLLVAGVLMACLSVLIFGGLIYLFLTSPGSWIYIGVLSVCGFSTFVSSILMLYDSLKLKLKKELDSKKTNREKRNKEIEQHIKVLTDQCERIKPESMR
jgi:type VI protein secretion system component VasK